MSVAREAGSRTKIAVLSRNPDVDSVGACIGARGVRVAKIVEELGGEKIDIIEYKEKPEEFIAAALSPANVVKVEILDEEGKSCRVTVPDSQLSLAIGNRGQNARLAARLTGWKVDIRPESGFYGEDEEEEKLVADDSAEETADVFVAETAEETVTEEKSETAEENAETVTEETIETAEENAETVTEETIETAEENTETVTEETSGTATENTETVSESESVE